SRVQGPAPQAGVPWPTKHGWGAFLLPFLEQQALHDQYRWDLNGADQGNQPASSTPMKIFQCPSAEPNRYMTFGPFEAYGGRGACGDSAATEGVVPVRASMGLIDRVGKYNGILELNALTPITAITDGTANTILLTEDAGRPRAWLAGRAGSDQSVSGG